MMKNLGRLWTFLPRRRQLQVLLLMIASIISSLVEAAAVGSILPFIAVLQDPEIIKAYAPGRILQEGLGPHLALGVTLIFCVSVLLSCALRVFMVWASSRVSQGAGSDIGAEIFRRTIYQPYSLHVTRSSNEVVDLLSAGVGALTAECLLPSVNIIANLFVIAAVGTLLLLVDPVVAITVVLGIGSLYALIAWLNRHRLDRLGVQSSLANREKIRTIQESVGGMRDVLINATQPSYCRHFGGADTILNHSRTGIRVLSQFPRYLIEAVGLVIVAIMAYRMSDGSNLSSSIAVLGTFAIGAQRTLPAIQNSFSSWASIRNSYAYIIRIVKYLDDSGPAPDSRGQSVEPLRFHDQIRLESVSFRYSTGAPLALNSVSLTIPKGSRVGIIGPSGSGKSTLVDLLMGLLEPSDGTLVIDGVPVNQSNRTAWQANLSHVPQSVFITEGSIEENIAFGIPAHKIDPFRVREAARMAQIHEFIESLPAGYATPGGERGIRLSGGQRQRIGIARALYRQCDVLVFDEATSALDNETEQSVMEAVDQLSKQLTIIFIAHRLTTLKGCDFVVQINNGKVERQGTYAALIENRVKG
jgi:ABC-type multidrug transport system fused ATPase/permease subunit